MIVTLYGYKYALYPNYNRVGIFPAFYSIDRHPTIHQVLANSFNKDQSSYTLPVVDAGEISALSIYLVDSCDMPNIHALTKNMTMTFPKITILNFCFENSCEIVSFLLTMIILEFKRRALYVISANAGDEENYLFIPRPTRVAL